MPPSQSTGQQLSGTSHRDLWGERSLPVVVPREYISGCHSIWFLNKESREPFGSRALDLLLHIYRGSTEARLLKILQRYIPGHVLLMPKCKPHARDRQASEPSHTPPAGYPNVQEAEKGNSMSSSAAGRQIVRGQLQHACFEELAAASERRPVGVASSIGAASKLAGTERSARATRRRKRQPLGSMLSDSDWAKVASLFHAFFAFYGYYFNSCSFLVSLRTPFPCLKQALRRSNLETGCRRCQEHYTGAPCCQSITACWPCSCGREVPAKCPEQHSLTSPYFNRELAWLQQAAAAGGEVHGGRRTIASHDAEPTAAASSTASSAGSSSAGGQTAEWDKVFIEGKVLEGPLDMVLRALGEQIKGAHAHTLHLIPGTCYEIGSKALLILYPRLLGGGDRVCITLVDAQAWGKRGLARLD